MSSTSAGGSQSSCHGLLRNPSLPSPRLLPRPLQGQGRSTSFCVSLAALPPSPCHAPDHQAHHASACRAVRPMYGHRRALGLAGRGSAAARCRPAAASGRDLPDVGAEEAGSGAPALPREGTRPHNGATGSSDARKQGSSLPPSWLTSAGCTASTVLLACRSFLGAAGCTAYAALVLAACTACTAQAASYPLQQQQPPAATQQLSSELAPLSQYSSTQHMQRTFDEAQAQASTSRGAFVERTAAVPSPSSSPSGSGFGLDSGSGSWSVSVASEAEDKLLEIVRQVETRVDSAVGSVTGILSESKEDAARADLTARTLIQEVWEVVDQNYLDARNTGFDRNRWARLRDQALEVKQYSSTGATYRQIRDMLARGLSDPYCRFITPDELAIMKKYDVTGIGLNLGTADEYVRKTGRPLPQSGGGSDSEGLEGVFVVGISKGSAADMAGIQQGDEVLKVDNQALRGFSPFQAASLIQGQQDAEPGTSLQQAPSVVTLKIRKPDGTIDVRRIDRPAKIIASPVSSRLIKAGMVRPDTTGMLRLSSFNARAHRDLAAAIADLEREGAQSLVLDLRTTAAAWFPRAWKSRACFLSPGSPIVITESRAYSTAVTASSSADGTPVASSSPSAPPLSSDSIPMSDRPALTRLPLTLLVNDHTASAAEIVAGALKDNCRAVLVGGQTYGKGLIQSVYELSDGSGLVITVGKYLTPNRTDIDRFGIRPDFVSQPSQEEFGRALDACRVSKEHDVLLELAAQQQYRPRGGGAAAAVATPAAGQGEGQAAVAAGDGVGKAE